MMADRIAILADVHGNITALDAVLRDAAVNKASQYWFLGDLFLPGPGRSELLAMLRAVHPTVWLRGNWERTIFDLVAGHIDVTNPVDIYQARLSEYLLEDLTTEDYAWLQQLPISTMVSVGHLTIGVSHSQPFRDDGRDLFPPEAQANFEQLFITPSQDIAVYAHTHTQLERVSQAGQLILNPGSVGQPFSNWPRFFKDHRANYLLLDVNDADEVTVNFRKVAYDEAAEIQLAKAMGEPYADLYAQIRKTGIPVNHSPEILAPINQREGYTEDVTKFFDL
ncbi:metallophosphoesterase family protein [Lacticaseibacillus brantae]|uniref:Calcineurin-like phosphoesterase domain-containing protein n=1 Tax=Lacticaseibacillus brantae DSM 23927 TaxID=1423727 RepID=A0A0R2AVN7_9LACO|nr:metallophosphoesterase family protein [Lacticaseibacillus brantae]KRM71448.1 hypothetical protein FC34_GL001560 [Lacticaseibacillus brantae DSM 23927]